MKIKGLQFRKLDYILKQRNADQTATSKRKVHRVISPSTYLSSCCYTTDLVCLKTTPIHLLIGLGPGSTKSSITGSKSKHWPGYDLSKGSRGEEVPGLFQLCWQLASHHFPSQPMWSHCLLFFVCQVFLSLLIIDTQLMQIISSCSQRFNLLKSSDILFAYGVTFIGARDQDLIFLGGYSA